MFRKFLIGVSCLVAFVCYVSFKMGYFNHSPAIGRWSGGSVDNSSIYANIELNRDGSGRLDVTPPTNFAGTLIPSSVGSFGPNSVGSLVRILDSVDISWRENSHIVTFEKDYRTDIVKPNVYLEQVGSSTIEIQPDVTFMKMHVSDGDFLHSPVKFHTLILFKEKNTLSDNQKIKIIMDEHTKEIEMQQLINPVKTDN